VSAAGPVAGIYIKEENMRHELDYKAGDRNAEKAESKAKARKTKKRKSQDQLMLEAAERNKSERKAGKPQTIEIFC
jgi:hypothetical protein